MQSKAGSQQVLIVYPATSQLTQGSIFTCAVAEEYETCTTYGLVITARCDVEQDKVRAYNYLPIVSLSDWLVRDGKLMIAERLLAETNGQMKNALKENGFSNSILETEAPRNILETLFPAGDKKANKARERFERLCLQHELATRGLANVPDRSLCMQLADTAPRLKDALIRDLVHQKTAGYYFFDRIEPKGDDMGYVVLLREIRLMPARVARSIMAGVDSKDYAALCQVEPRCNTSLHVGPNDFAMPVGLLASPFLEHLMQSFAMLFGRIGLPDPDPAYVAGLWERHGSILKENS